MPAPTSIRRCLISVYDKTGIVDFARALHGEFGIEIISTGGTAKTLREAGIPVTLIEDITGFPEMLDGRVKTLHPAIHAGILADRDNPEHMRQLEAHGIKPIDMVVVSLYPFEKTVADPNCTFEQAIEMIDIGGVTLLRAAAKNHKHVLLISEQFQFDEALKALRARSGDTLTDLREVGALMGFGKTSWYDDEIYRWLPRSDKAPRPFEQLLLERMRELRYGENAHQISAAFAPVVEFPWLSLPDADRASDQFLRNEQQLSHNNYLDADAALGLCAELARARSRLSGLIARNTQHPLIAGAPQSNVPQSSAPQSNVPQSSAPQSSAPQSGVPQSGASQPGSPQQAAAPQRASAPISVKVEHPLSAGDVSPPLSAGYVLRPPSATASGRKTREFPLLKDERASRRNLPHLQRPGASYFISFRVRTGQLSADERDIVMECCLFPRGKTAAIHAIVVMPDHVHLLMTPLEATPGKWVQLGEIMKGVRGVSSRRINALRGESGTFWIDEYFDHILRDERELHETLEYMYANPTTDGLDASGPYPWCVFETELGWDRESRAVGLNTRPAWIAGQVVPDRAVAPRAWFALLSQEKSVLIARDTRHPLIAGAPQSGAPHSGTPHAGAPQFGAPHAGAPHAAPPAGSGCSTIKSESACSTIKSESECSTPNVEHPLSAGDVSRPLSAGSPHACVLIKHTNACGAAVHADPVEAYRKAYLGDPNAAMGGILAVDFVVDAGFAAVVMETYARFGKPLKDAGATFAPGGFFVEVWIAPRFTNDAVAVIRGTYNPSAAKPESGEPRLGADGAPEAPKKDWGQRVRLLAVGDMTVEPDPDAKVYRSIAGGMLVQTPDTLGLNEDQWKVVTNRAPTDAEMDDLRLAWLVCKHTRSNAITICREGMLLGNGAGQMSRVMSCRIATWLARENGHGLEGNREEETGNREEARGHAGTQARREEDSPNHFSSPVAASDAFFPFPDGPRILIDAGVTALIQPGGGKRDQETIDLCNERGVTMIFTSTRHFRH